MKQYCETSFNKDETSFNKDETSFNNGKLNAELTFQPMSLKYCACHEKVMPDHTKCCTCHTKSSSRNWRSDAPKCNPLRKSAPWPPNISDEHVSCTAPAMENASSQILFKCPTPAMVFRKPSRFAHFWKGAQSLMPATQNHIWTSKSAWCVLHILTSICASRYNSVHFFDISTSKSGPRPSVFNTFNFEMCFAPQRRALYRHLNFRSWGVLYILTSECASGDNGVQFFISHLTRWLRTRRFSEPTFRSSGATNHWKNTVFRDFATFSRPCIFFLLTLSLLWSSLFCSSPLWLFPPLLFHLSILSEVWLLNFLR